MHQSEDLIRVSSTNIMNLFLDDMFCAATVWYCSWIIFRTHMCMGNISLLVYGNRDWGWV